MKLKARERNGAKVKKIHDKPKTPYQRLLEIPKIPPAIHERLRAEVAIRYMSSDWMAELGLYDV